ncbi:hypothetical protein [Deinococcus hopiensis]|uniref:hypothetical protein n=1 Tax=Deinococcus hopiensis TaxID=309885 RepID=UPI001FEC6D7B|nr:hypothetical protein [Deinococcus hopiensis]
MKLLDLFTLLVAAALAFLKAQFPKLPASIGATLGGAPVSLALLVLVTRQVPLAVRAVDLVREVDFAFQGVLPFLLFAGALGLNSHAR